jgi:hypothetical protein
VNLTSVKAFIEICVFYRIWVKSFAIIAVPIYAIFRKNKFKWEKEQRQAIVRLKKILTSPPALVAIDYSKNAGKIILAINSNLKSLGAVFMQMVKKRKAPSRYENGMWNDVE